jgi:hypothetical protein
MSGTRERPTDGTGRLGRDGPSTTVAVAILVATLVVSAGVGYLVLSTGPRSQASTGVFCPSPYCPAPPPGEPTLYVPPGLGPEEETYLQGQIVPAVVTAPGGEVTAEYRINWGDGSSSLGPTSVATHVYPTLGSYILSAQTLDDRSIWHNGTSYLVPLIVAPSAATRDAGTYPTLVTALSNSGGVPPGVGWLEGGGTIRVSADYSSPPAAPGYSTGVPSLISTGGTRSAYVQTPSGVSASYFFSAAGTFYITMVGQISGPNGPTYQNYTWTVIVTPTGLVPGCALCSVRSGMVATSPHPGTITAYEVVPAGASSVDPAVDYETIGAEIIYNIYQTLVAYNGSSTASFLPQLATCVPGSPQCVAEYGSNLTVDNLSLGGPEYWTFVLDKNARFYDPATGASWPVYPSDVMFSMIRTLSFANLPAVESTAGWILAQSLLPAGNASWDVSSVTGTGIHAPFNNTPSNILGAMLVNDSTYCPASAMTGENGCITFKAIGPGAQNGATKAHLWSDFLQFVADPLGGGITPAGWFNDQGPGAAVRDWPSSSNAKGDGPTLLPGGVTSTNTTGFKTAAAAIGPTAWDVLDKQMFLSPEVNPTTRFTAVGSGPYYLVAVSQSIGYTLKANPGYEQPYGCTGQAGCEPAAGKYATNVSVSWESIDTPGILQYLAGQTDFAGILPAETATMLSLAEQGKVGVIAEPTLNINLLALALTFNVSAVRPFDPNPLNVPGDFFSYIALREFLVNAFPYATVENTIFTTDGIPYGSNYGGAIPQYLGNYYPTNISWPTGDPDTNPAINGSAAWWWAQATALGSPYYDPELANCSTASPCEFPLLGENGAPGLSRAIQEYLANISSISGGRLAPNTASCVGFGCGLLTGGPPTMPMYDVGWAPDYPDPTDYVGPLYSPNGTYSASDSLYPTLAPLICAQGPNPSSMAGLLYWAHQPTVPQACQGNAYAAMVYGISAAAPLIAGAERILLYNLVEQVASHLALYVYYDQENAWTTYAAWIDPMTVNTNPMIGGVGDNSWYLYGGNGVTA